MWEEVGEGEEEEDVEEVEQEEEGEEVEVRAHRAAVQHRGDPVERLPGSQPAVRPQTRVRPGAEEERRGGGWDGEEGEKRG